MYPQNIEPATNEFATHGIELKTLNRGIDLCYQIKGSCISSPQRYQLLSIVILLITLIKPQIFTLIVGLALAGWSSRRFKLTVSSTNGVELTLFMILPYKKVKLPLLGTQIKLFDIQAASSPSKDLQFNTSSVENQLVELGLTHPKLHTDPLTLLSLDRRSARKISQLFGQWVKQVHQERSLSARTPLRLFNHEPGEWMIAMIDLFPYILAPKCYQSVVRTKLSWWSPSSSIILVALGVMTLGILLILFQPLIGSLLICFALTLICSDREVFILDQQEVIWRKFRLGLPVNELNFGTQLNLKLEEDLHAPSGRRVLVTNTADPLMTLSTGHPWDSAWIFRELKGSLDQHFKTAR